MHICIRKTRFHIKRSITQISKQVKLLIGESHASFQLANHRNIFKAKHIKIHPDYGDLYNDISLIEVQPPMDFDKPLEHNRHHISPICLSVKSTNRSRYENTEYF